MTEITFRGYPIHLVGSLPAVGTQAPDFTLTKSDMSEFNLKNHKGQSVLLNIFPSIDTPTCAEALHHFEELAQHFPDLLFLCVSADLPFAQQRVCAFENVKNLQPASVFRHPTFGQDYGILMVDGPFKGLLSRAVVLINPQGKIIYTELVKELVDEPNFNNIQNVLEQASKELNQWEVPI